MSASFHHSYTPLAILLCDCGKYAEPEDHAAAVHDCISFRLSPLLLLLIPILTLDTEVTPSLARLQARAPYRASTASHRPCIMYHSCAPHMDNDEEIKSSKSNTVITIKTHNTLMLAPRKASCTRPLLDMDPKSLLSQNIQNRPLPSPKVHETSPEPSRLI